MSTSIPVSSVRYAVGTLLYHTFEVGGGVYLSPGTSLFETLDGVTAEEASQRLSPSGSNIAAHVDHTRLYLWVVEHEMRKKPYEVDWEAIWRDTRAVTADEWDTLRQNLRAAYDSVNAAMDEITDWDAENRFIDPLAILAHSAYHLGAIRQILYVVR